MSHDGLYVVREGGAQRYFYDRWAALQNARLLLTGPDATLRYVRGLEETSEPAAFRFTCGAIFVDVDRGVVLYWADQLVERSWTSHRYFRLLLAERWPGWTLRWALRPARDFSEALGVPFRDLEFEAREPARLEAIRDAYDARWSSFRDGMPADELAALIAEHGEDEVLAWAEHDHAAWVSVRWRDGRVDDHLLPDELDHVLDCGPALIDYLRERRPIGELSLRVREDQPTQTALIDEQTREVRWWWVIPQWLSPGWARTSWPGWTLMQHDGGPREHMARTGRDLEAIRCPPEEAFPRVREALARTLRAEYDPAGWLASVARGLSVGPGERVHVETRASRGGAVGASSAGDELDEALRRLFAAHP